MKIMLICAGGVSTGMLMKKMEKWAQEKDISFEVKAYGINSYEEKYKDYDCILLGPQIAYKLEEIKNTVDIPVDQIAPLDYAMGNVDSVMKLVDRLLQK